MSNLEDEIAHKMSMQMQREVDREVLWGMLKEIGWTRVGYYSPADQSKVEEILNWVKNNSQGAYEHHHTDYIFENQKDAVTFILRWS